MFPGYLHPSGKHTKNHIGIFCTKPIERRYNNHFLHYAIRHTQLHQTTSIAIKVIKYD